MSSIVSLVHDTIHDATLPLANALRLEKLPENAPTIVSSALFFWGVHMIGAPMVSRTLFPSVYGSLKSRRDRNNWNNRVAAFLHAVLVIPLALRAFDSPAQDADRIFGWDERTGLAVAIGCGYFIWDCFESTIHWNEVGFVIHAYMCFSIFFLTFKPFIAYYAPRFLLWELSTPFLNIHWFLDKLGKTGSTLQLLNGIILLSTFAGARLIYGSKMSFEFWKTMYEIRHDDSVPMIVPLTYCLGNVLLNGLNWYWFYKMVAALRRRMQDPKANAKILKPQSSPNGHIKAQ